MSDYILSEFVKVVPGEPYKLFPFGPVVKAGKRKMITPEYAATFRLPHFRPAIKLGSHKEVTPAGGFIIGLEVRADGLYAIPEWNSQGAGAVERGDYRYHSPEVIWEGGGLEHPETGELIEGPLIMGDALLHTPHLGEAAALYTIETQEGESSMSDQEMVPVPRGVWDRLMDLFSAGARQETDAAQQEGASSDAPSVAQQYEAERAEFQARLDEQQAELEEYRARAQELEAAQARASRIEHFGAELAETAAAGDTELHELLADLPEETAAAVTQRIRAFAAQAALADAEREIGHPGNTETGDSDPVANLNARALALAEAENIDYLTAVDRIRSTNPDLAIAAFPVERR